MNRCIGKTCTDGPGGEKMPRWADTPSLLCRRCGQRLEQHLAELPARRDMLRAVLGGLSSRSSSGNRPTKGEPPLPLNVGAHDHLELLHATLTSWAQLVIEERRLHGPGNDTADIARWLLAQHPWLIEQPWVDDLADELDDLAWTADTLTDLRRHWNRLPITCPDCEQDHLGRWDGDSTVTCRACDSTRTEHEYARLVHALASDSRRSVTAAEAVALAGVKPATFRQWVSRHKVRRLGTAYGQTRYSADDLERVLRERDTPA